MANIEILAPQGGALPRGKSSPWFMWGVAVGFVFFQFFMQLSSGVMLGKLIQSFHTTTFGAGMLIGSFYIVYTLLQVPAGVMVDRYGPRRLLTAGALVCALGTWIFAMSHTLVDAAAGRALMGMGASFAFVASIHISAKWFPLNRFGMMVGLAETIGMLSTLFGNVYIAHVLSEVPWRQTMEVAAGIAVLISILCFLVIRDTKPANSISTNQFLSQAIRVFKSPNMWLNGIYSGIIFALVTVFAGLWLLPYFMLVDNISLVTATLISSMIYVGGALGSPVMGFLYNYVARPRWLLFYCASAAAMIVAYLVFMPPHSLVLTGFMMFILGLLVSSYVINFALVKELVPEALISTGTGFINMLAVVTAPILQPLLGWIIEISASGDAKNAALVHYSLASFHWALGLFVPLLLLAGVLALLISLE